MPVLHAQVGSTELTGEVRDQTRLVIAGATVADRDLKTGVFSVVLALPGIFHRRRADWAYGHTLCRS